MSRAIDDLKNDHEGILLGLQILEELVARIDRKGAVPADDAQQLVDFLREFADQCHHGKEEGILFPAMVSAGVPEKNGPIGVMLDDHANGRRLLGNMANSLSGEADYGSFAKSAREYIQLLRSHIQKENNVLFPMADKLLADSKLEEIYAGFEEHEEKVIGQGRHEQLHAMLNEFNIKYMKQMPL